MRQIPVAREPAATASEAAAETDRRAPVAARDFFVNRVAARRVLPPLDMPTLLSIPSGGAALRGLRRLAALLAALGLTGCFALPMPGTTARSEAPRPRRDLRAPHHPAPFEPTHVSAFFEPLSHHGSWVRRGIHWHWRPSDPSFAPLRDGRWVLTEFGPTWVSAAPFGWAVEHYGAWTLGASGWEWRPDTRWAPARAMWRRSQDAIGWAPELVPETGDIPPARLWRFADNPSFFAGLRRGDAAAPPADPHFNAYHLARSRAMSAWRVDHAGRLVAVGPRVSPPVRPMASLDPNATRWQPRWARETVTAASSLPRAARDPAERRTRRPLSTKGPAR